MRNHYLPQFVLRRFDDGNGLWEWNTQTGEFQRKNISNAGQRRGFYTDELETGFLQRSDGVAAGIFKRRIDESNGLSQMSGEEREQLAEWIALWMIRGPKTYGHVEEFVDSERVYPKIVLAVLERRSDELIALFQSASPDMYQSLMDDLGREDAHDVIIDAQKHLIASGKISYMPETKKMFSEFIDEARVRTYAKHLLRMSWRWLRTANGFVVGDNPVCCWSRIRKRWNYGIARPDVEITVPVSRSYCVMMRPEQHKGKLTEFCSWAATRELNDRQMCSAALHVYGAKRDLEGPASLHTDAAIQSRRLAKPPRFPPK